jgi:broad specificity phosphatase PhoE
LVRHGETDWNAEGRWQGQQDSPLNETGREQARLTARKLADKGVAVKTVYTSDLKRASETAEIIAEALGAETVIKETFREVCVGDWEGLHHTEIRQQELFADFEAGETRAPNGESKREVYDRVVKALHGIAETETGDFIVATHSLVIRMLVCHILRTPISDWDTFAIDNGALTAVKYREKNKRFMVVTLNERIM